MKPKESRGFWMEKCGECGKPLVMPTEQLPVILQVRLSRKTMAQLMDRARHTGEQPEWIARGWVWDGLKRAGYE